MLPLSKFIALLLAAFSLFPSTTNSFSFKLINAKAGGKKLLRILRREPKEPENFPFPARNEALMVQPKRRKVEAKLQEKYAAIDNLEERAFQILLDLGMVVQN
mmetsp:Transcript_88797/g.247136  ORF Transcript_88797/g.247136 Transcript_88797/m.247136 type:complete len:103 (+) Transcript_88797:120-428(+)